MKEQKQKKDKKKKQSSDSKSKRRYILFLLVALISILMISSSFALLSRYSQIIEKEASTIALEYVETTANNVRAGIERYKQNVQRIAIAIKNDTYKDVDEFRAELGAVKRNTSYGNVLNVRFYKDGREYNLDGEEFDMAIESESIKKTLEKHIVSCAGVVTDRDYSVSSVAFCVPIDYFDYADALVVFYSVDSVVNYSSKIADGDYSSSIISAICTTEGEIVNLLYTEDTEKAQLHSDIYTVLRRETNNKEMVDEINRVAIAGDASAYPFYLSGSTCVLSVSGINDSGNNCFAIVGFYRAADIYESGYFIIRVVLGQFIIYFSLVLVAAIYGLIATYRNKKLINTLNDTNALLDCATRSKFERVGAEILARNKATNFAIVVIDIEHYEYLLDHLGSESMLSLLRMMKTIYSKTMQLDETFAYFDNGRFALLLHYRTEEDIEQRVTSAVTLVSQQAAKAATNTAITQIGGIYETERNLTDVFPKMIDLAIDAEKATSQPCNFGAFRIYNETMYASTVMNDYVEVHMESALQNHDFKVFYQPKYNIHEDRIDGCEALVRWYNPERDEYMQPGVFLPLFEANRFIIKLDHYVYEQVLLYIEDSIENGLPLAPVSVNVSRITAIDRDFVSYYTNLKREHNIADGFITIEFTESFAYEDYDMLRETVTQLHKSGFKCSIDDFGSGFSSYNILKELPMDEIKLDRFFIKEGYSSDRDLLILSSIIKLGRDLRMKVTQEGVEFGDQVELLKKLGCQVIQGYHYSKPLSLTDYVGFLTTKKVMFN